MKIMIRIIAILFMWMEVAGAQPVTLVTLGDSLTAGDGDTDGKGGYPARLISRLKSDYPGSVLYQFAISGDTTADMVAKQLQPALEAIRNAPKNHRKVALVWIGSNDLFGFYNYTAGEDWCRQMGLDACERSEMKSASENVRKVIRTLRKNGAECFVALLDDQTKRPVIADRKMRAEAFGEITDAFVKRMKRELERYNERIERIAAEEGAGTVDFFSAGIFEKRELLDTDGNHPNSRGYDAITEIWYKALDGRGR